MSGQQFEAFNTLKENIDDNTTKESLQDLHDNLIEHVKSEEVTETSVEDKITIIENKLNGLVEEQADLQDEVEAYKNELEGTLKFIKEELSKLEDQVNKQKNDNDELPEDASARDEVVHFFKGDWKKQVATVILGAASFATIMPGGEKMYAQIEGWVNEKLLGKEAPDNSKEKGAETDTNLKEKIENMSKDDLLEKLATDHKENFKYERSLARLPLMDKGTLRLMVLMLSKEKFKHLRITSTLRTKEENDKVGGKDTSKHLKGLGFDIGEADSNKQPTYTLEEAQRYINQQYVPGAIYTKIHGTNRHLHVGLTSGKESGPFADAAQVDAALDGLDPIV